MRYVLILVAFLFLHTIGKSQNFSFAYRNLPDLRDSAGVVLKAGFAGGLNAPQVSKVHLNEDLILDLVVFDRASDRLLTFVADHTQPEGWRYEPYYQQFFPTKLNAWVFMRDFNNDGRVDIFTYNKTERGITVYRNTTIVRGNPQFELAEHMVYSTLLSGTRTPLTLNSLDLPNISDIDGDGDLDVVNIEITGNGFEFHKNLSMEQFGNPNQFKFEKITNCFGGVFSTTVCGQYTYAICRENITETTRPSVPNAVNHQGATVLLAELTGDGNTDMILGDISCPQAYFFADSNASTGFKFNRMSATYPATLSMGTVANFAAGYHQDLDADGVNDLLITSNVPEEETLVNLQKNNTFFYRNTGTNQNPNFQFQRNDWLYSQMLDLGGGAKPTVGDVDADGDLDIILGSRGFIKNGFESSALVWLKNNGGNFQYETGDWLGLSNWRKARIQPDFADLNHDGKPDLVVHYQVSAVTRNSTIQVLFNLATGNQPWRFDTSAAVTLNTINNINQFDSPLFYDVDADGLRDLLLGKNFGRIQYYRNTGTASNPAFTLTNPLFGIIDYSEQFGYSLSPAIADFNGDGIDDLITTDSRGYIAFYPNVRDGLNNSLNPDTSFYRNTLADNTRQVFLGKNLHPAVIDYNADGNPDLIFGTTEGGLLALTNTRTLLPLGSNTVVEKTKFEVYPNPATDQLQVIAAPLSTFTIYSMQGKVVQTGIIDSDGKASISVKGLYSGTYLLQSEGRTQKFVKQ
jgi:hypothetical protein